MTFVPGIAVSRRDGRIESIALGHPLIDEYLIFIGARARPNTWLAIATDMKVFFSVVHKDPAAVATADVFTFLAAQRAPRRGDNVVRLEDRETGLASRTIARRLSTMRGLFAYLVARGDAGVATNSVPVGLAVRRPRTGRAQRATPLIGLLARCLAFCHRTRSTLSSRLFDVTGIRPSSKPWCWAG